jgi:Tfp pilus assembly protein PilF
MTESAEQVYKRALSEMKKEQWLDVIKLLKRETAVVQKNCRFSWNLGWCYVKLDKFDNARKHMIRAARLAPDNPTCKWGLGNVYLKKKHFKKAEVVLTESLGIKESHLTRIALALAFLYAWAMQSTAGSTGFERYGKQQRPKHSGYSDRQSVSPNIFL